jgi:iron complex transport system substrate-binding protein
MRIVSVGGAVTEIVFALGEGASVVAVDTSSTYPETVTKLPKVGYQRTLGAEAILATTPSVVLATEDAGPAAALEQLRAAGVRVVVATADPSGAGARARITAIARAIDRDPLPLLQALDRDLTEARSVVETSADRPRALVVYSRGDKTLHVLGRNTAGQAMLDLAGADNVASALLGGIVLLVADAIARTAALPAELPLGVVTAALGAPFFLVLVARRRSLGA